MGLFDEDTPGWVRALAAGLVVFALVVVGGVVALIVRGHHDEAEGQTPASTSATPPGGDCGTVGHPNDTIPTTAPETRWIATPSGFVAPYSDTYGPGRSESGVHSCFEHSPTGAVLAASQMLADSSDTSALQSAEYRTRFYPNEASRALLERAQSHPASDGRVKIMGFQVSPDYSPDAATVIMALSVSPSRAADVPISFSIRLRWFEGDWRLFIANTTDPYGSAPLSSLAGFVSWGPEES